MKLYWPSLYTLIAAIFALQTSAQLQEMSAPLATTSSGDISTSSFFNHKEDWTEDVKSRTLTSALWKKTDGTVMLEQCQRPIHYYLDGQLERITTTLEKNNLGWIAPHQPNPLTIENEGTIVLSSSSDDAIRLAESIWINGTKANLHQRLKDDQIILAENIVPGIHREIKVQENAVKYQFVVEQAAEILDDHFTVEEFTTLPDGCEIVAEEHSGKWDNDLWKGNLLIKKGHRIVGTMRAAICFDAKNNYTIGGYSWKKLNNTNQWLISTKIDKTWMQNSNRIYPVIIDPLVTGPTSFWPFEPMPACVFPNFNVDSILVNVPGQISVTGLFVTGSFFANGVMGSIMDDGAMYYSTNCGSTSLFEATAPFDTLPGTAYLLSFDMRNPLMCCYEPSCSEQSFYLRMHITRYIPDGDCDLIYVYYDPATLWPFTAFIEGHTVEKYQEGWSIPSAPICSNDCETVARAKMRYGVPPYTITHPWMAAPLVIEEPTPCDLAGKIANCPLILPDCPVYCPNFTSIDVEPCIITDACMNTAAEIPIAVINVKPAPNVFLDPLKICSDEPALQPFESCIEDATFTWNGNNASGEGIMPVQITNDSGQIIEYPFSVTSEVNNCESEPMPFNVAVYPIPVVDFTMSPDPALVGQLSNFASISLDPAGADILTWNWTFNGIDGFEGDNINQAFSSIGTNLVCLSIVTENNCPASICKNVDVTSTSVEAPNIFTPNGDGKNDTLEFLRLEYFPDNELEVYNRWGNIVYSQKSYRNTWNGADMADGTYYYILKVKNLGDYSGYIQIVR